MAEAWTKLADFASVVVYRNTQKYYNADETEEKMGLTLTEKILSAHLAEGEMVKGQPIKIKIDQTLTQDATGTMAYLEFEAMDIPRVKTELSVSYVDHNTVQVGFENFDDQEYLRTVAD